jgi:RNA polymerase sigma-70 factor (ECF subfamily)
MSRGLARSRTAAGRIRFAPISAYLRRLLTFLRRKGRTHEDAEDLIQEALLRLHRYGQSVPVANEEAFLRRAVNNLSIDQYRHDRPDLRKEVPIEELNAQTPLIAPEPTPDEILEAQQRLDRIRAVLEAVSLRTREIYFAHRAGYSYAEIADHMNISPTTIKRHIARALLAIMEHGKF